MAGGVIRRGLKLGKDQLHKLTGSMSRIDRLKDPTGVPGPGMFDPAKMTWEEYLQAPVSLRGPIADKIQRSPLLRRRKKH